jgi:hypothetical protein
MRLLTGQSEEVLLLVLDVLKCGCGDGNIGSVDYGT